MFSHYNYFRKTLWQYVLMKGMCTPHDPRHRLLITDTTIEYILFPKDMSRIFTEALFIIDPT